MFLLMALLALVAPPPRVHRLRPARLARGCVALVMGLIALLLGGVALALAQLPLPPIGG